MLLKKLYENHFLEIDALLTKEGKRLKLSPNDLFVLKTLFTMYKRRTFSITSIARKIELSSGEIAKSVDNLAKSGFVSLELETRKDKQVEVFNLDGTFNIITDLYLNDIREENISKNESNLSETIKSLENALNKTLSANELQLIQSWYEEDLYSHEMIISEIKKHELSGRFSIRYLERLLNQTKLNKKPIDKKTAEMLDSIFKDIK
ncbi:MAG: DnaD domain protein [Acholeplasmataceae bacterium]